jgi:sugar phosphate isomerase/epimerase
MEKVMLLGLETFSYHLALGRGRMDIFGFIERTVKLGLDGVQVNIGPATTSRGHLGSDDPGLLREVREAVTASGMYIEIDTRGTDPVFLKRILTLCSGIGADVLRLYAVPDGHVRTGLARAADDLVEILPVCADLGVRIAFENHEHETSLEILEVVHRIDSPWVGTLVDTGNGMMVWEDPVQAVRNLSRLAVSSHFKDQVVYLEESEATVAGVAIGRGNIDCEECFRILAQDSPLKLVNIEVCYDYRAPFRRPREEGASTRLGAGAFTLVEPPYEASFIAPPTSRRSEEQDQQMIEWQDQAVVESVAFVKGLDGKLGA